MRGWGLPSIASRAPVSSPIDTIWITIEGNTAVFCIACVSEVPVERLYREIRALRIYEGATEVQQLIIARELLKDLHI